MSAATTSKQEELTALKAKALKAYATKAYAASADLYAQACELQSEINGGDDDPRNAQLLYLYGRSLYKVAQSKSDVLGGVGGDSNPEASSSAAAGSSSSKPATIPEESEAPPKKAGLLQFAGDENWDNDEEGDDEEADEEEGEGEASNEDDLESAWEILDLARTLFEKQLPTLDPESNEYKNTRTMLADVFDLLGEVSLESESFANAVKDLSSSLELKEQIYPPESTLIAEAHFKLSLALEFTAAGEGMEEQDAKNLRDAAAEHIEKAIAACNARIAAEEKKLKLAAANADPEDKGKAKESPAEAAAHKEIENVKEMVTELEQRLEDLRNPQPEMPEDDKLQGLLGQIMAGGGDPATAKRVLEQAMGQANDLTSMVRKKEKKPEPSTSTIVSTTTEATSSATTEVTSSSTTEAASASITEAASSTTTTLVASAELSDSGSTVSKSKRKAEVVEETMVVVQEAVSKKARVEDTDDSGL